MDVVMMSGSLFSCLCDGTNLRSCCSFCLQADLSYMKHMKGKKWVSVCNNMWNLTAAHCALVAVVTSVSFFPAGTGMALKLHCLRVRHFRDLSSQQSQNSL